MRTVAVIPARAGSKRLPGKHLRRLGGEPLIAHTVRAALASSRIDRVLISTDDPAVAAIGRRLGAEVPFMRPAQLAGDGAPTAPVIQHAVAWLEAHGDSVDIAVTLQATSPLREAPEIDRVVALLDDPTVQSALSVSPLGLPAGVIGFVVDGRMLRGFPGAGDAEPRTAPLPVRITGGVYATRRALLDRGQLLDDRPAVLVVDGESAIDVDEEADLLAARRAWRAARKGGGRP